MIDCLVMAALIFLLVVAAWHHRSPMHHRSRWLPALSVWQRRTPVLDVRPRRSHWNHALISSFYTSGSFSYRHSRWFRFGRLAGLRQLPVRVGYGLLLLPTLPYRPPGLQCQGLPQ